jgi:hypothetical protein
MSDNVIVRTTFKTLIPVSIKISAGARMNASL